MTGLGLGSTTSITSIGAVGVEEVMELGKSLGITIGIDTKRLELVVKPKEQITPELREGIKANRDELTRMLLFRDAGSWLDRVVAGKPQNAVDAATKVYLDKTGNLNTLWQVGTLEEFRDVLKEGMRLAREVLLDEQIIKSNQEVLELAREHFEAV